MSIWKRCFGNKDLDPLQRLLRQKRIIEQRGCFSDQEIDEKYDELDVINRRINEVKHERLRQHIQSA